MKKLLIRLKKYNIDVQGIAVSDEKLNPSEIGSTKVKSINEYDKKSYIIISVADKEQVREIRSNLINRGYHSIYTLDRNLRIDDGINVYLKCSVT